MSVLGKIKIMRGLPIIQIDCKDSPWLILRTEMSRRALLEVSITPYDILTLSR